MRKDIDRAAAEPAPTSELLPGQTASVPGLESGSGLRRRRDLLAAQVTELHWDLGGLAYEMAIRDHFRLDVLVRRAAGLQELDGLLAETERLLRMEDAGEAGHCPACAAPYSRGALFCWQCGATLMRRVPSEAADHREGVSDVLDALLAARGPGDEPPGRSDE